jgi:hypothetical protein
MFSEKIHILGVDENVNIDTFPPRERFSARPGAKLVIGDLHGNALKFLYILVRHEFLDMPSEDYLKFVRLYKVANLRKVHLDDFNLILKAISLNPLATSSSLCLIGDDLCDRGQNDYFVLKLFQLLHQMAVRYEILISNHSAEFLSCYENNFDFDKTILFGGQGRSSENLQLLVDSQLVTRGDISELFEASYKPYLKALSYSSSSEDKCDLTIYSHAPIGLENIGYIAKFFGAPEAVDDQFGSICVAIDQINMKFREYVSANAAYELFKIHECLFEIMNGSAISATLLPMAHLIWNRDHESSNRPGHITFVHGHDTSHADDNLENVFNLDNSLGKGASMHKGEYKFLYLKCFQC